MAAAAAPWLPPPPPDLTGEPGDPAGGAAYLAGRGAAGLRELRRCVEAARADGAEWVRRIPLGCAVMRGHVRSTLRYLVEEARVETLNTLVHGNSPLHLAVIWGRVDCAAYLLARGADPRLRCCLGETAAEKARVRLERLQDKLAEDIPWRSDGSCIGKKDISKIREEGKVLVDLLDAVEASGSYSRWASLCGEHRLARRFPSLILFSPAEERARLAALRALLLQGRAELSLVARPGAISEAPGCGAEAPDSLEAAMAAAGVGDLAEALQERFGPYSTASELAAARLTRHQLQQVDVSEGDGRRLLRFAVELQQQEQPRHSKGRTKKGADQRAKAALALAATATVAQRKGQQQPHNTPSGCGRGCPGGGGAVAASAAPFAAAPSAAASGSGAGGGQEHSHEASADGRFIDGLRTLFDLDLPVGPFAVVAFFLCGGPSSRPAAAAEVRRRPAAGW